MCLHDGFVQLQQKNNPTRNVDFLTDPLTLEMIRITRYAKINVKSFGLFYKLALDVHGQNKIVDLDFNLDAHYPNNGHTKCMHQSKYRWIEWPSSSYVRWTLINKFLVRAKTTADKIVILLWTWPSRSAADNSIRNKILSYRVVIEDDEEDEDEEDSEEDYDFDLDWFPKTVQLLNKIPLPDFPKDI